MGPTSNAAKTMLAATLALIVLSAIAACGASGAPGEWVDAPSDTSVQATSNPTDALPETRQNTDTPSDDTPSQTTPSQTSDSSPQEYNTDDPTTRDDHDNDGNNDVGATTPQGGEVAPASLTSVLTVVFFDIGQGDSILVSLPTGERILIDAAESNKVGAVTSYLRESGIDTIDYLVATHPHADHIGGMASVIVSFAVKSVWMPDATTTTKTFENLLDAIEARGLEIDIAGAGAVLFDYGTIKAEFVAPVGSGYKDLNDYSAVLKLTYGERVFLFMGDAETVSENEIVSSGADIAADVLKVGHHGSNSSSSRAFVQKVNPTYAVISSGAGNSYGHPAAKTLSTFADLGVTVLRTDINGMVVFHTDGQYLDYTTERSQVGTPPR